MSYVSLVLAFIESHGPTVAMRGFEILLAFNMLTKAIPAAKMAMIERDWPRIANVMRLSRSFGPDGAKALRVLVAIVTGRPWMALASEPTPPPAEFVPQQKESDK